MQQGRLIHLPAFGIAATPSMALRSTLLALFSTTVATTMAVLLIPDDPSTDGALFYPALVMSAGLATAPLFTAFRYPKALLRGECRVSEIVSRASDGPTLSVMSFPT